MDPLSCNRGFHESWLVICGGTVVDGTEAETFAAYVNALDTQNLEERMPEPARISSLERRVSCKELRDTK